MSIQKETEVVLFVDTTCNRLRLSLCGSKRLFFHQPLIVGSIVYCFTLLSGVWKQQRRTKTKLRTTEKGRWTDSAEQRLTDSSGAGDK